MSDMVKDLLVTLSVIAIIGILAYFCAKLDKINNTEVHGDDLDVTEWISPDGVHYWYQKDSYHEMLAPRYDSNGNLVIDN